MRFASRPRTVFGIDIMDNNVLPITLGGRSSIYREDSGAGRAQRRGTHIVQLMAVRLGDSPHDVSCFVYFLCFLLSIPPNTTAVSVQQLYVLIMFYS